ncbi:MAG: TIGR03960 family B12-binding radical SAM protein [Armatimonadota bacterium]
MPKIEKPSRYLGTELNSVHKNPDDVRVRICLAFPDLYDLGLSNLGLMILYHILNARSDVWAERVYAPGLDMEAQLRSRGLPLFSLESKTPLSAFDAVGFSLQYELSYTNVLNMIELGGIPLLASDRGDDDPIVLAGGPCAYNPEPMADYFDAFFIGDGEAGALELADVLRDTKGMPRAERLLALSHVEGVYVPAFVRTVRRPNGMVVPEPGASRIRKRLLVSLEGAPFPSAYVVPFAEQAHDRVSLEVLRGCTQACRFCQAGMTYRPVRERTVQTIVGLIEEVLRRTGYDEVALSSLSTCDYSRVRQMVRAAAEIAAKYCASVSLPSLRLDSFSLDLADMVQAVRKSGLTFAPEAATPKLRAVINKWISDEDILSVTRQVFERGWDLVKLYFMIGLPTETDSDVIAIAELARSVLQAGRAVNPRARINLGVSTFVPKPHTPFQWERQISVEETIYKQELLRRHLRHAALKFGRHDAHMSWLEGVVSRGDRRLGKVILQAYRAGARLDAWSEHFSFERWIGAFAQVGVDPDAYLRERSPDEPLPWDHIECLVSREYLLADRNRSRQWEVVRDCRYDRCHQCGLMAHAKQACTTMLQTSQIGRREDSLTPTALQVRTPRGAEPRQRIRFRFWRLREIRFLSHRETMNLLIRALRRAAIPIHYSQGFNPQPKLALGSALPVGMESEGEYADVVLTTPIAPASFLTTLNSELPTGLRATSAWECPLSAPSLMSLICAERYRVWLRPGSEGALPKLTIDGAREAIARFLTSERVPVQRRGKGGIRSLDIRGMVVEMTAEVEHDNCLRLELLLRDFEGNRPKLYEVLAAVLGTTEENARLLPARKLESYVALNGELVPVCSLADCQADARLPRRQAKPILANKPAKPSRRSVGDR